MEPRQLVQSWVDAFNRGLRVGQHGAASFRTASGGCSLRSQGLPLPKEP